MKSIERIEIYEQKNAFLNDLKVLLKKHNTKLVSSTTWFDNCIDYNICISGKYNMFIEMDLVMKLTKSAD